MRKIQSFVRRSGRLTLGQKMGLTDFWKDYGVDLPKGKIDLNALFIKRQEVVLEVGFGNGDSLLEMAISMPDKNFLGIEVYEAGIGRLINEAHKCQLGNLKIIQADAVEVLTEHIENDSLSRFQLFFPDPWHKKKHHKRRLVNCDFLDILSQKIKQNGEIHMATDWEHYAIQMMDNLKSHPHFKNTQSDPIYSPRPNYRPMTKFERRGERLGHGVWDLIFTNEKT
ncbi:tRNA (guanine(46)-N(7))-methyltransferase (EC 2.1.1.33) [uncultured Gammaproteobacteria bacterium]|jgi:tRNA (guanine-N7-)-methyltransferase|nr:tRNA (guanine(46)-N(7))-methyltransferase (EC 2.1.1.33) [uncultured Gammaproteobacteria bacterium]CAC9549033.1 tRNA (guanine(46)-N(7))-methyltransferase (EC 2.1.1.33) [uncultured Gammaproteobacteria bacterium]CAC9552140.1 tRNA (guanine(46)-N(7))-methyltransferase (EC 2.1.1.33) [uncultured Gammaproteobacteria bacterium]CAC9556340.1 tRNA (guanine(46)-N(7))-methyltransferase (EC 2.1.1.33) [uncultured Gammaproteobacteria bacterium]CAC9559019.1 tRNA (guanine(46)-N(7))-methyltransferase (EC 2.1.1.